MSSDKTVVLREFATAGEAHVALARLEAESIRAFVSGDVPNAAEFSVFGRLQYSVPAQGGSSFLESILDGVSGRLDTVTERPESVLFRLIVPILFELGTAGIECVCNFIPGRKR